MSNENQAPEMPEVMPEQIKYANLLSLGAWSGMFLLVVTFLLYCFGVMEPAIPIEKVVANWHLSVSDFGKATGAPHGWQWLSLLGTGDYVNFIGLAILGGITILCYLILLPGFLKQKDNIYVTIVILEVLVLCFAASGLLGSGGH